MVRRISSALILAALCAFGQTIPASFFGQSTGSTSRIPSVPFYSLRLWDSGVTWNAIETSVGVYSWTRLDAWLSAAQTAGAVVNINLAGTPNFYSSAPTDTCSSSFAINAATSNGACDPPSDVSSGDAHWKAFVTALVQHSLASSTAHIASYSIWNEPNQDATHSTHYWLGTTSQLITLATDAAAIIHSLDPSAIVVSPEVTYDGRYTNGPSDWFSGWFTAGGTNLQDAFAIHYYPHDASGNYGGDPELELTYFDNLKTLLAANGVSAKPIYVTETNWGNYTALSAAQQAGWTARDYLLMLHKGVTRAWWYSWDASSGTGACGNTAWGKMYDTTLGICPAGSAFQFLQTYLASGTATSPFCTNGGDDTWSCLFKTAAGKTAQFLWNINAASRTISADTRFNSCLNLDGTTCTITNHAVSIGASPVLLLMN